MLIGGLQPFTLSDFPGRTAAIVFSQGCNFRCPYCHNRHLWPNRSDGADLVPVDEVLAFLFKRKDFLGGLVITGGEPTLQSDLSDFIRQVKRLGLEVKLDTNGSRPEAIEALLAEDLLDYVAMDVKAPCSKYDQLCGGAVDKAAIRKSIGLIAGSRVRHHFRTTFFKALLSLADVEVIRDMLPPHSEFHVQPYRDAKRPVRISEDNSHVRKVDCRTDEPCGQDHVYGFSEPVAY